MSGFAPDHFSKMAGRDFLASLASHANAVRAIPGTPYPLALAFDEAARRLGNQPLPSGVALNYFQSLTDQDFTNEVGKFAKLAHARPDTAVSVPLILDETFTRLKNKQPAATTEGEQ